ncbi:MAG: hypothetical protein ACLRQF_06175 [Thomasclavelia ramosa]
MIILIISLNAKKLKFEKNNKIANVAYKLVFSNGILSSYDEELDVEVYQIFKTKS